MVTRIHVRRDRIASDNKTGHVSRAIGIETSGMRKRYARVVKIDGPCTIIYNPRRPLKCGAKAWIETSAPVRMGT